MTQQYVAVEELFEGEDHSKIYEKFRPKISDTIIRTIVDFLAEDKQFKWEVAIDVGCGTGQASDKLAAYFSTVLAVDVSSSQIATAQKRADKPPNVQFMVGPAEKLSVKDESVDLVTAFVALHYFDLPIFFAELKRILKPSGVLVVYGYWDIAYRSNKPSADPLLCVAKEKLWQELAPYEHPNTERIKNLYRNIDFPFPVVRKEWEESIDYSLYDYLGLIQSFSPYQAMLKKDSDKAKKVIQDFEENVLKALGTTDPKESKILIIKKSCLIFCRNKNTEK